MFKTMFSREWKSLHIELLFYTQECKIYLSSSKSILALSYDPTSPNPQKRRDAAGPSFTWAPHPQSAVRFLWVQEAPTRSLKIYLKVNPVLTFSERAAYAQRLKNIPGSFIPLMLLDQATECGVELSDKIQCRKLSPQGMAFSPPHISTWTQATVKGPEVQGWDRFPP